MPRLSPMDLKALRWFVRPEYAGAPDETFELTVDSAISGLSDSTAEDFLKALSSIGQTVGLTLQRAAPNIVQGAGATVEGPWGALVGAGAGLASGCLVANVISQDNVLWYVGHLWHRASEGPDHYHAVGPIIRVHQP